MPPDGCISLAFRRGSPTAVVLGPWTVPLTPPVVAGDAFFGVRFWPGAAGALLPIEPRKLKDRVVPAVEFPELAWSQKLIAELWRGAGETLDPGSAERALQALVPGARPLDAPMVAAARRVMATGGEVAIAELAADAALSPRQFRRRFTAAVGLSPKELARIWRLRRCALAALDASTPRGRALGGARRGARLRRPGPPGARVPSPAGPPADRLRPPVRAHRPPRPAADLSRLLVPSGTP